MLCLLLKNINDIIYMNGGANVQVIEKFLKGKFDNPDLILKAGMTIESSLLPDE